jgi:predicted dehydrogenase
VFRFGLIGLGYWGPNYARVLNELHETELVAACDLSEDATSFIRDRYPQARTTRDAADLLSADDIDAVIIATPTKTHFPLALAALQAGKHVLCEKPLARTTAECDELIAAANESGAVLFVGHTFIYNPAVRRMRTLVENGEVGRVLYCHSARTGLGPFRADVNALWDLAPHDVSIFLYLMGRDPVSVWAVGQSFLRTQHEDVVFLYVRFDDDSMAAAHLSWLDPYKVRRLTLVGDRRMLVFDDVSSDEKLKIFDRGASYEAVSVEARGAEFGEFKAIVRDGDIHVPKLQASEPLKEQVRHFVDCCVNGATPETGARSGRNVIAVLEAAMASLQANGTPVELSPLSVRVG